MSRTARLATYGAVSTRLALLSDRQLCNLLASAQPIGSGIGGRAVLLEIEGTRIFVKRVPLTDVERSPENVMSTANLFRLPNFFQYGIGSTGFGVWRELATHHMTTNWVIGAQGQCFPLMYHWRVLPDPVPSLPAELGDVERVVEYWAGSPAVRARVEAIMRSSASVVIFLEYIPRTLGEWFGVRIAEGGEAAEAACLMVERCLTAGTSFMNSRGLLHFDAHFENILTDGERLYFADFGLAVCSRFELSVTEVEFFQGNLNYDRCYTVTHLVHRLVTALYGFERADRDAVVRECAEGGDLMDIPARVAAVITRYAPIAVVMNEFYQKLQNESRTVRYPAEKFQEICARTDFPIT